MIDPSDRLKHRQLVSSIRGELAGGLSTEAFQKVLARYWKPYLGDTTTALVDTTCYESEVRYPADVKLLWESVHWLYEMRYQLHKSYRLWMPRTKDKKWGYSLPDLLPQTEASGQTSQSDEGALTSALGQTLRHS